MGHPLDVIKQYAEMDKRGLPATYTFHSMVYEYPNMNEDLPQEHLTQMVRISWHDRHMGLRCGLFSYSERLGWVY